MRAKLRAWDQADFLDVRHVIWNTWMATYGSFVPEEDLRSFFEDHYGVEALEKQFENPDTVCYVAEVDGHVVAYERTFFNKEEKRQYVASLYVLPENQGSGLGKHLMRMAAQEARRRGLDNVWLGVMVQNQQAVDWYKKMGYQIVEEAPFTMGNTTVPHFVGYVPVQKIETSAEKISKQRER